ncbi:MAG: type 3 dihydrofolate reductase [Candidatus Pacebacteria bacterium]|nr:type 3 dihydrofolate reductase [Candidatus Paceibacterota bacterium]
MIISIIAAVADNMVIGKNNALPWHLPADFEYFKKVSLGKPIIMGARTFESIGKALPGRTNIVLSNNPSYRADGCLVASDLEAALKLAEPADEVMIGGGASVYKQFLPLADKMYLTFVHHNFEGDTFFPEFDNNHWQEIFREDRKADEKNSYAYSFVVFERKKYGQNS